MATNKRKQTNPQPKKKALLFGKKNYQFLFLGLILMALGFILMSGGGSHNQDVWNPEIFNFRRIRLAPMLILLGLLVEVYAIMLKSDK